MIYVFGNAFHSVKNLGPNLAESRNFSYPGWVEDAKALKPCGCQALTFPYKDLPYFEDPTLSLYSPHRFDPLRFQKIALVDIAKKSNDPDFLTGVQRDLNKSWLLPHYGSAFLKLYGPEKLQDHKDDDDEAVAKNQDQHEDDGEVVEHEAQVDAEGPEPEHTYSSCLRCMQVLSEQMFHGHLADNNECRLFYLKKFAKEKYNLQEWNWDDEEMYKKFRNFVNDDRKRIYRYQNKSEEEKSKFSQCPNCSRKYLRIGSHLAAFEGCKNAQYI